MRQKALKKTRPNKANLTISQYTYVRPCLEQALNMCMFKQSLQFDITLKLNSSQHETDNIKERRPEAE
jgi:hypothetical protein